MLIWQTSIMIATLMKDSDGLRQRPSDRSANPPPTPTLLRKAHTSRQDNKSNIHKRHLGMKGAPSTLATALPGRLLWKIERWGNRRSAVVPIAMNDNFV